MRLRALRGAACVAIAVAGGAPVFRAQEYKPNLPVDHPAIDYNRTRPHDAVSALSEQLAAGRLTLAEGPEPLGILPALLDQLHVAPDTQMLVFSKTSFQAARISPARPRAIYFNDEIAVAYVPGAPSLEIVAVDPVKGPMFYTVSVGASGKAAIGRGEPCLRCHQGPNTAGVPGIYVGSVIPGPSGAPLRDDSAIITDHRSPFAERWGGWYVTARRGEQPDRANAVATNPADPESLVREARRNLLRVDALFSPAAYLAPTSDIVALMTFEHQTQMTNLITRVAWDAQIGGRANGDAIAPSTLDEDVEDLVRYMLFSDEAPLTEPIEGVASFTRTFPQRGPRDSRGRSLRDFDLKIRLFRYPLSYMIYSASFSALPGTIKARIYRRMADILGGEDRSAAYRHLSSADRTAIAEILRDTKDDLPPGWPAGTRRSR